MSNIAGNLTKARPEALLIMGARALAHLTITQAARQLRTGVQRLRRLAREHRLTFADRYLSNAEVVAAIKQYGATDSASTLSDRIHVGETRILDLAASYGLPLQRFRHAHDCSELRNDNGYWTKLCPGCERWLGVEFFHEHATNRTGLRSWCKACCRSRKGHQPHR